MGKAAWLGSSAMFAIPAALAVALAGRSAPHEASLAPAAPSEVRPADLSPKPEARTKGDEARDEQDEPYVFRRPSGEPTALTCDEARTIIDQVRAGLAYEPQAISTAMFAAATADWLDPHGLLSVAKEAPTTAAIAKVASALLADIEGKTKRACASALAPGATLEAWTSELRASFDRGRVAFVGKPTDDAATEPLPPTGNPKDAAFEIGRRVGAFEAAHAELGHTYGDQARERFFPSIGKEGWARVVLASAVRAYVPLVDPHGEWAPFDEESRIYELDLTSRPPSRLWMRAVPTAIGIRLGDGTAAPLASGDIVLELGGVKTVGLPLEQVDQLGFAEIATESGQSELSSAPLTAMVLRKGRVQTLTLAAEDEPDDLPQEDDALPYERVPYGAGDVAIIEIKDVRDDLGDQLADLLARERERGSRPLTGVVLDLRDNGGGSTDGAIGALSLFLPGQPLFAMRRRDGSIEVDRAAVPRARDVWTGPVATFVDGTTASAAEMIAGALAAYRRGPTIGTTTFGKGCAQEYVDDDAHAGVLRMTTLVYALPDGSPVQRIGLTPQIRFPFPAAEDVASDDREAKLVHVAPPWRGPDLRPRTSPQVEGAAWPSPGNVLGPCQEQNVCRALRLLGNPKRSAVAKHG